MVTTARPDDLVIDGAHGAGGGQIVRSTVTLAALFGQPVRITNIRRQRRKPGLQAQHLTAVKAAAEVCNADVGGAALGSDSFRFVPTQPPAAGDYVYDVADARRGGSAGSTSLVLQTVLLPLSFATSDSRVIVKGGTHVAWSPAYHYLADVFLPTLEPSGLAASLNLEQWGWYPHGQGVVSAEISGLGRDTLLRSLDLTERGDLVGLSGFSAVSNLPDHILERQAMAAEGLLQDAGFEAKLDRVKPPAAGPGTAVHIVAEYEHVRAGFTSYGRRGKRAETVAADAVDAFIAYHRTGAAADPHLADQLVLPLALAQSASQFTTSEITAHLLTNIWLAQRFTGARFDVDGRLGHAGLVTIHV
jgi:RNA 3'-terminal phosphate cyclase (ATP)